MAEMAIMGSLLKVVFEKIFKKLGSDFMEALNLPKEVLLKLNEWESLLPDIEALLVDAEVKLLYNPNSNDRIKEWFFEIKNLAYDIEDVLDGFEVSALIRGNLGRTPNQASTSTSTSKLIPSCFNCFKHSYFTVDSETKSKVKSIDERLQSIIQRSTKLNLLRQPLGDKLPKEIDTSATRRTTTSLPEPHVYGRENEKSAILRQLLDNEGSSKGFSVVSIQGMGGVGKTTIAQLVYNAVKPESFELKAWVCVSDRFDVAGITRTILEAVGDKRDSNDLNLLQQALHNKLSNKKFLLVLDDVWNENFSLWDRLRKPFLSGAAGSKILLTTRHERVVEIMGGKDRVHRLQLLKYEECLSIFAQHALGHQSFDKHPNLKDVGEKLVKNCKGLPLAAKTLGGLLCGRLDPSEWSRISNSKIWELSENESHILPSLRLSYLYLPSYLKPCFAYCAMFPKDHQFDRNKLVLLWMAGGILKEPSEEVGHRYFSELVSRAFFQQLKGDESHCYVMHDLIHDLAQFIAGEMCFDEERMLEVDEKSKVNHEKVRHLSFYPNRYDVSKRFEFLKEMRSLRTFLSSITPGWDVMIGRHFLSSEVVHDWLPKLKGLRALSLESYEIAELPDSIGDLRCLTYLSLCYTGIKYLPESVGFLIRLQSLLLSNCEGFQKFPKTIGNLTELHHLDVMHTYSLEEMPVELSNLNKLVTMSKFIVGKTNESLRLYHLENFSRLRGKLSILDLHNVVDVADAMRASLGKIDGLDELILKWTSDFSDSRNECNIELQVLNRLKPHLHLKRLKVVSYGGKEFSSWIGDPAFSKLSRLELRNCKRCTSLPSLGLLPALEYLTITGMHAVTAVGIEFFGLNGTFPSLVELVFDDMLKWEEWTCPIGGSEIFPCLYKLEITNCPMLIGELPSHLCSLEELVIKTCSKLESLNRTSLPSCRVLEIEDCQEMSMVDLTSFARLESLWVERCPSLQCFVRDKIPITLKSVRMQRDNHDSNDSLQCTALESIKINGGYANLKIFLSLGSCLISLKRLEIYDIEGCESLPEMSLSIPNLEYLKMENCPSIESTPDGGFPPNLLELHISKCENLKSLPKLASSTPNLKHLEIVECSAIECIPDGGLPPNLLVLHISECENLKSLPKLGLSTPNLEDLKIKDCPVIECISDGGLPKNLLKLDIYRCKNLKSLPDTIGLLELLQTLLIIGCENLKFLVKSMHSLRSLEKLCIIRCPGVEYISDGRLPPNLEVLTLTECENLKSLPNTMYVPTSLRELTIGNGNLMAGWNLHSLTSLQRIKISKACPPDLVLPSSVTVLELDSLENQESISKLFFQNLISLQSLDIWYCPKLHSLPKEAMPPSLGVLRIINCPLLKRQRFEAKGDYWPLARNIPYALIFGHLVDPSPRTNS